MIGLDAPELHPHGRPADYWAHESTQALRDRALGRNVIVRLEPLDQRDRYGRLLAYLYVDEAEMLNLGMVRDGQAYADRRFRHAHRRQFEEAEDEARRRQRGLWKEVREEQMPEWRRRWLEAHGR
jgi:endonuclease YncB( thermonuclease family)